MSENPPVDSLADDFVARSCAADVRDRFADYNARFGAITRRAKGRFERREWAERRGDAVDRIELYDRCVQETREHLEQRLGPRAHDKALWGRIRHHYAAFVSELLDREFNKTFFNTLTRRFFETQGVDPAIEFVALDIEPTDRITHPVARHSYAVSHDLPSTLLHVLDDRPFAPGYAH